MIPDTIGESDGSSSQSSDFGNVVQIELSDPFAELPPRSPPVLSLNATPSTRYNVDCTVSIAAKSGLNRPGFYSNRLHESLLESKHRPLSQARRLSTVVVAGLQVEAFADDSFRWMREEHSVPGDILKDLNLVDKYDKSSKGAEPMWFSACGDYVLKALGTADTQSMKAITRDYMERVVEGSILVPIYMHFRFRSCDATPERKELGFPSYIVMRNLMPAEGTWKNRYDLKGCDDDKTLEADNLRVRAVHKRFWHFWYTECCWSDERWNYFKGKMEAKNLRLVLPEGERNELLSCMYGDVQWLIDAGLMDYSLLLGVQRFPITVLEGKKGKEFFNEIRNRCPGSHSFVAVDTEVQKTVSFTVDNLTEFNSGRIAKLNSVMSKMGLNPDDWEHAEKEKNQREEELAMGFPLRVEYKLLKKTRNFPVIAVTFGIVDFLQSWTFKKKVTSCLKFFETSRATVPPDIYGERFLRELQKRLVPSDAVQSVVEGEEKVHIDPAEEINDGPLAPLAFS